MLVEENGFEICAEAADADAAVDAVVRERPELCLVDAELPGGAIRAVGRIASKAPATEVVVLAREPSEDGVVDALRAGAVGYLPADTDPEGLVRALRAARAGEAVVPRRLLRTLIEQLGARERGSRLSLPGGDVELTRRQAEVLKLFREGLSTAEIAGRLGLSAVTVRRHLALVLEKLGAADRAEALALLEDAGEP